MLQSSLARNLGKLTSLRWNRYHTSAATANPRLIAPTVYEGGKRSKFDREEDAQPGLSSKRSP